MTARDQAVTTFNLPSRRKLYYGGQWHGSLSGGVTEIVCPSTGESLGTASEGGAPDIDRAVAAAAGAFPQW
jgi:acyl-CoA reductase-like NAD-dependent aldehyde dehydrogenase